MNNNPDVIDGYRGSRSERKAEAAANAAKRGAGPAMSSIPEGKRVFQFIASKYRFQVTAPEDLRLSDGRLIKGERAIAVQAKDYLAVLDIKKDELAIQSLVESPYYGREFWDLAEIIEKAQKKQAENLVSGLTDPSVIAQLTPEQRASIAEKLLMSGEDEFTLPNAKK